MDVRRYLSPSLVAATFDAATIRRGRSYVRDGRVQRRLVDAGARELSATCLVTGADPLPYVVHVDVIEHRGRPLVSTRCTCPVRFACKHGAAALISLVEPAPRAPAGEPWEHALDDLVADLAPLAPPADAPTPVALLISWEEHLRHRLHPRSGHDPGPLLRLRPMRPGSREPWVRSGLGWGQVAAAQVAQRHDPAQIEVLAALASSLSRHGSSFYAGPDPVVGDFGPDVVPLLGEAQAAGVTLLAGAGLSAVNLAEEPWQLAVDAARRPDAVVRLSLGVEAAGRWWSGEAVRVWGEPAHTAMLLDDGEVTLGRLARRLPAGAVRALTEASAVELPAGTDPSSEVLAGRLAALRRLVPVGSRDGSVVLPPPTAPVLVTAVEWHGATHACLSWRWRYADTLLHLDDPHPVRDAPAERALLSTVGDGPRPGHASLAVEGADAVHLALTTLPRWRALPGVAVEERGRPDVHEARAAPAVAFTPVAPDATDHGEPDWLDLDVSITADGESFPLPEVIAALTRGDELVVLPSGLFVRADHPALARLHELVRAAAEVHETSGRRVRLGRHDLATWSELTRIGVVEAQAARWVARARTLQDVERLPRPEVTGVVSTLRDYQLDGFAWLALLWRHRLGGVLADDMGLGKTLQVLALVAHTRRTSSRPFLVVAPTSVVSAWAAESQRHTPSLRVAVVRAGARRRGVGIADLADEADVVVTSYTLLRLETEAYRAVAWEGLVLDEAQQVKNHRSLAWQAARSVEAPFRLAVSGTPFENRLGELWALLAIVAPGLYPQLSSFSRHVAGPVEKDGDHEALARFQRRIRPLLLRRTKDQVAPDLPPKQEQVVTVELSERHRRAYDVHLSRERQRVLGLLEDADGAPGQQVQILAALTRLRQLALDPALVEDGAAGGTYSPAKTEALVGRVRELLAGGHRTLVFSSFTGYLRRVRERLDAAGVPTAYLDGSTADREAAVARFRSGEAPVFLVSLKAGGVGLTLTEADYVFVLDPWWNPAAEAQAVDRAHRIGQHRPVLVYRLVAADTIEEKVLALQQRKADLFRRVVEGGAGGGRLSADDVRALLE